MVSASGFRYGQSGIAPFAVERACTLLGGPWSEGSSLGRKGSSLGRGIFGLGRTIGQGGRGVGWRGARGRVGAFLGALRWGLKAYFGQVTTLQQPIHAVGRAKLNHRTAESSLSFEIT